MTCALCRDVKKSFGLELRLVKDKNQKSEFETKARSVESDFLKAETNLADLKSKGREKDKQDLLRGNKSRFNVEGRDNDDLLTDAANIQDETMQSLARSQALVEASKEIGTATIEVLVNQREQIADIADEIDNIDSNLVRAEKLIISFGKRIATDRILQFFTAVNMILIIAVVAYAATHKKNSLNSGSNDNNSGNGP